MSSYLLRIRALAVLVIGLLGNQAIAGGSGKSQADETETYFILGGSEKGTYDTFIRALDSAVDELEISHQ